MKKNTVSLAFLVVSVALVTACEKGGPRTAPDAIAKLRCQSEKAFNTRKENLNLANALSQNSNVENENAIRTYVTKFDISEEKNLSTVPTVMNPNNVVLVSTQKADEAFAQSATAESIVLETNCEDLSASVKGPGFEMQGLTIKKIDTNMIELEKTAVTEVEGKSVVQDIKMKIDKSSNLNVEAQALQALVDSKKPVVDKHLKKKKLSGIKKQEAARGNTTTKISIEVTSTLISGEKRTEAYNIEQRAGELFNESSVTFEGSVVQMIKDRTSVVGTPEFIVEAAKAEGDSSMKVDPITGGKVSEEENEDFGKFRVTILEKTQVNELIKKLNSAAGLSLNQTEEKAAEQEPALAQEQTPTQAAKTTAKQSVGVQAE